MWAAGMRGSDMDEEEGMRWWGGGGLLLGVDWWNEDGRFECEPVPVAEPEEEVRGAWLGGLDDLVMDEDDEWRG